jgi:hypothetical protein
MKTLVILLSLSSSAFAQSETWTNTGQSTNYSNCCSNGACWMERGSTCHSDPSVRESVILQSNGEMSTISNGPIPKCEDGWTLVLRPLGTYGTAACARELKDTIH